MKIYVRITPDDISSFTEYIQNSSFTVRIAVGIYCFDNIANTSMLYEIGEKDLPESYIMKWDPKLFDDIYHNRVIGRFNQDKLQWTLMDSQAMTPMIQVLQYGCKKYDRDNWKKACPKRLDLMDSLQRHALAMIAGEAIDKESGLPHIGHLMCNAMFYSYWEQQTNGLFENYKKEN